MNFYYHKAIGINMIAFWKSILSLGKGMILPIIAGALIMKFVTFGGILTFALWVCIYAVVYVISMWLFGMNDFEKNLILQPVRRLTGAGKHD